MSSWKTNIRDYDLIVIGTGLAGSINAYLAATRLNKKVLMLEKRDHIAGNMYDYRDPEYNLLIQKYGPHVWHTKDKRLHDFITGIGRWEPFTLFQCAQIDQRISPVPFNFKTIDAYWAPEEAERLKARLQSAYPNAGSVPILELMKSEDEKIREYASFLFEKDYKPYAIKQWGIEPDKLDVSILARVPVRLSYEDAYYPEEYEALPQSGYTEFFNEMLNDGNIEIQLNTNALSIISIEGSRLRFNGVETDVPVLYSGPLDELFAFEYGALPYRSLYFEYELHETDSFQDVCLIAYPQEKGYTRITERTKLPPQSGGGKTVITKEYPCAYSSEKGNEPYYPVLTEASKAMYAKYQGAAARIKNLYPCGRLADFRYYNMDQVTERAMQVFHTLEW